MLLTKIKNFIKKYIFGIQTQTGKKKPPFYDFLEPDAFFDVGANIGMSGEYFLGLNINAPVYSFEPVLHLFNALKSNAAKHSNWHVFNVGVGDHKTKLNINVSGGHGGASSFLKMTDEFNSIAQDQIVSKSELVEIITLSDFYKEQNLDFKRIFLKLDVQGFELNVLRGCNSILDKIAGLKIEVSIKKQYHEEPDIFEILPYLFDLGFVLYTIEDGWRNPVTKELLQIDLYMFKPEFINYSPKTE